jgi:hypothetical protein
MVDPYIEEETYTHEQNIWLDAIDKGVICPAETIQKLKELHAQPWLHPSNNVRWLWDYCLNYSILKESE